FKEAWAGEADCRNCALRSSVLFAGLEEADFERLHKPIDQFVLQPGAMLYYAGQQGSQMFTIRSGLVKLSQLLPDGSQRIVRLMRSTDIIGLETLLDQPYEHDAVVMQRTEICALPVAVVRELQARNPALHTELLARWQRALKDADEWITQLSTGSAKQRVARLLLRLVKDEPSSECELFGREDMGAMLGITTETASRTVAEFKRQSLLLETSTNRFLLDVPNLRLIADL
ncbi:MAG: Crp/Fnr family transcriptional regulator, partial [Gammaproteobacteria bacterium]